MKRNEPVWVVGHRITPVDVTGDYDFVLGETPGGTPGPPPHYHTGYTELFHVVSGEMEFMIDGKVTIVKTGETVDLPPNTLHTFNNTSDQTARWINIHSPKGFRSFFESLGVLDTESDALQQSVSKESIDKVIQQAADFDMHIKL
ncbi:MAG: cupin domain-containing protein [Flavobacteriales bacterium]|nr:cupin domain-containing protein [Flavobacteriales bacterium]